MLERLVAGLEEDAVLRVADLGFAWGEAEKGRVEHLHLLQDRHRLHIVGVGDGGLADAGVEQFLIRKGFDRFRAVDQVLPELLDIPCSRKMAGHPYDGDAVRLIHMVHESCLLCFEDSVPAVRRFRARARASIRC